MKSAKITISFPKKNKVRVASKKISLKKFKRIYDFIDYTRDNRIDKKVKYNVKESDKFLIRDLITLHNAKGTQKRNKLLSMKLDIKSGKDIFEFEDFPNVNLIKYNNEIIAFDGHHTVLAYLMAGRKFLRDVPYILIESKEIKDKDLLVFFGEHKNKISPRKWRDYCINWNVSPSKQLEKRKQETIGDVFDLLKKG